jgi:2-dehydro-3-deoxygalactonokinase
VGKATFIAGDWGTSHLRLFLCDSEGSSIDTLHGPGASEVGGRYSESFTTLTDVWRQRHGQLPAVLCGMVGSNFGWLQAPYVACPTRLEHIADACVPVPDTLVRIVPGLSCINQFGAPDFMRGEETQILGAMHLAQQLGVGRRLLCLPGTHTKWVMVVDGTIREFLTAVSGELFAVLRKHSVLVRDPRGDADPTDLQAFHQGMTEFKNFPQAQLVHRIFECRARQLSGEITAHAADAYLSGLCIASDVLGALRLFSQSTPPEPVHVIGSSELSRLYAAALKHQHCEVHSLNGSGASLAGIAQVQRRLSRDSV